MSSVKNIAYVGILTALAVSSRLMKHALMGSLQFLNLPLLFAMLGGRLFGPSVGFSTGFLSFLVSDSLLGIGPWTAVTGSLSGVIGGLWSKIRSRDRFTLFITAYVSIFLYDILSSWILYLLFGLGPVEALIVGTLGLFIPISGGWMIAIGPLTETVTSVVLVLLLSRVDEGTFRTIRISN